MLWSAMVLALVAPLAVVAPVAPTASAELETLSLSATKAASAPIVASTSKKCPSAIGGSTPKTRARTP
jgi:hypothetical protein